MSETIKQVEKFKYLPCYEIDKLSPEEVKEYRLKEEEYEKQQKLEKTENRINVAHSNINTFFESFKENKSMKKKSKLFYGLTLLAREAYRGSGKAAYDLWLLDDKLSTEVEFILEIRLK